MLSWDKATVGKIIGILLTAILALLSIAGYDVVVIQPREALRADLAAEALKGAEGLEVALAAGDVMPVGGGLYAVSSTGPVGIELGAPAKSGMELYLYGSGAFPIAMNGPYVGSSGLVVGPGELVELVSVGGRWVATKRGDS